MGAVESVAWLMGRLAAAEQLWEQSGRPWPHADYSLMIETVEDEAFFMSDFADK